MGDITEYQDRIFSCYTTSGKLTAKGVIELDDICQELQTKLASMEDKNSEEYSALYQVYLDAQAPFGFASSRVKP
ncbi:hypothetical protein [Aliagarivorans taiwanensis]|uniref:hypothetical protein n=1 Tax=Aliagarivorans taiwanensis TaxID=561966 RepID=UPI0003FEB7CE|nr:hypothetical protein [Aliagarivorans taiwanensis]